MTRSHGSTTSIPVSGRSESRGATTATLGGMGTANTVSELRTPLATIIGDALRNAGWTVDSRGRWISPRPLLSVVGITHGTRRDEPMSMVAAVSSQLRHEHTWGSGR